MHSDSRQANPALLIQALLYECMFRMYARNSHTYTHLILALGIVRESTVWGFIASPSLWHTDIGLLKARQDPLQRMLL